MDFSLYLTLIRVIPHAEKEGGKNMHQHFASRTEQKSSYWSVHHAVNLREYINYSKKIAPIYPMDHFNIHFNFQIQDKVWLTYASSYDYYSLPLIISSAKVVCLLPNNVGTSNATWDTFISRLEFKKDNKQKCDLILQDLFKIYFNSPSFTV